MVCVPCGMLHQPAARVLATQPDRVFLCAHIYPCHMHGIEAGGAPQVGTMQASTSQGSLIQPRTPEDRIGQVSAI